MLFHHFTKCFILFTDASTRDKPVWQRKSALAGTPNSAADNLLDGRNRFRRTRPRLQPGETDRPMAAITPTISVVQPAPVIAEKNFNLFRMK